MKRAFACLVAGVVLCIALTNERAEAQKAGSSGSSGRSYSSGGSRSASPSRSPSSSSPSRSAPSSSGSSSGKSYSSGSSSRSTPATPSGGTASSPSTGGKSYSSGSSKPSTPSSPTSSKPSSSVATGKSDSSGSAPRAPSPPPFPSSSPGQTTSQPVAPSGKSYSSGSPRPTSQPAASSPSPSGRSYAVPSSHSAPAFDSKAAEAQRHEESRRAFNPGPKPKPQYTDSRTNTTYDVDHQDRRVEHLRRELDHERWVNRRSRVDRYYAGYPSAGWTVVHYRDPYSDWFWWWMLSQSLDTRASWAYHHRQSMDEARYRDMLRRDASLEARIRQLEAERVARDPKYAPGGLDYDLMYDDSYVDAVYNPISAPALETRPAPATYTSSGGSSLFVWLIAICFVVFLIWLVFFKRWSVSNA